MSTVTQHDSIADRVTVAEARRAFESGATVLVSEYGHETQQAVTHGTVTHDRTRISWDELAGMVTMWRGRYPNQRYYIVRATPSCSCARNTDGSVTTMLCPAHADRDPCATMAAVTGRRRRGSVVKGVCSACGWSLAS